MTLNEFGNMVIDYTLVVEMFMKELSEDTDTGELERLIDLLNTQHQRVLFALDEIFPQGEQ